MSLSRNESRRVSGHLLREPSPLLGRRLRSYLGQRLRELLSEEPISMEQLCALGALDPSYGNATLHSAVVTVKNGTSISISCNDSAQVTAKGGQIFSTTCDTNQTGNDIWQIHEETIQDCLDACASWAGGECKAVVYDTQLINGWENCRLKSAISVGVYATNMTLAVSSVSSGSNPGNQNGGTAGASNTTSKAWIAGPIIGAVLVLGAVAYGISCWRKRRASHKSERFEKDPQMRGDAAAKFLVWGSEGTEQRIPLNEMDGEQAMYHGEMDGSHIRSPVEMSS